MQQSYHKTEGPARPLPSCTDLLIFRNTERMSTWPLWTWAHWQPRPPDSRAPSFDISPAIHGCLYWGWRVGQQRGCSEFQEGSLPDLPASVWISPKADLETRIQEQVVYWEIIPESTARAWRSRTGKGGMINKMYVNERVTAVGKLGLNPIPGTLRETV